ncbi:HalOD1 output domain-containing protein [Halosimplex aquaticum]|uniref:HalOD1 output domain-containing protein n=1 Tax=Halosimplex aquaticum TaxID=3026162 RepID=A0ABD5Y871_9EURY
MIEVVEYDIPADESVGHAVIRTVSDFKDCPITSLPPLQTVIDVDALNKIFESDSNKDPHVIFNYTGLSISICSSGFLTVNTCHPVPHETKSDS